MSVRIRHYASWQLPISCRSFIELEADGGESGIRYLDVLLESVSYRFQVAPRPIFAIRSADHCTLLHAGPRRYNPWWMDGLWDFCVHYWPDFLVAALLAVIVDLFRIGSLIRGGIGYIKNKLAEGSAARLRKRIAVLESYRDIVRSYADKALYLGALRAILIVLMLMCTAAAVIVADSLGFLLNGKVMGCFILAYTIGITFAALRFYALDMDTKQKFQKVMSKLDKDIAGLKDKLGRSARP